MNSRIVSSVSKALFDTDLIMTRLLLAMSEFGWGVMLLWPGDTFGRPTYAAMARVMHEEAWAGLFLVTSAMQLSIVILDDYHSRFARYFAAYNAALWWYVVVGMLCSVYPPPAAIAGEISLSVASFWIWFRPYKLREFFLKGREHVGSQF
jgi:hypothetical protein